MADRPTSDASPRTAARAARWVARMGSDHATSADRAALADWLLRDHANRDAFRDQTALWNAIGSLADDPAARTFLRGEPAADTTPIERQISRRGWLYGLATAAAASVVALTAVPMLDHGDEYATAIGEQRSITLADGSVVTLDTESEVQVKLTGRERRIQLLAGQAFFDVARDTTRPFRVLVGKSEVRALGTAFSIRKDGERSQVFLARGSVAVREPGAPPIKLEAGEQAQLASKGSINIQKVDPERAQAWRYGRLMFDATPLATAIEEINRYGGRKIILSDPALGDVKISGVFHTRQPEAFVETVVAIFPVRLAHSGADAIILAPSS